LTWNHGLKRTGTKKRRGYDVRPYQLQFSLIVLSIKTRRLPITYFIKIRLQLSSNPADG